LYSAFAKAPPAYGVSRVAGGALLFGETIILFAVERWQTLAFRHWRNQNNSIEFNIRRDDVGLAKGF